MEDAILEVEQQAIAVVVDVAEVEVANDLQPPGDEATKSAGWGGEAWKAGPCDQGPEDPRADRNEMRFSSWWRLGRRAREQPTYKEALCCRELLPLLAHPSPWNSPNAGP